MDKKFNIIKATRGEIAEYIDDQQAMMQEVNSRALAAGRNAVFSNPKNDCLNWEIVKVGEGFKIAKREKPLEFFEDADGIGIRQIQKTISERLGIDHHRNSKYHDAERLNTVALADGASLEVKELQADGSGNLN